jgi:hypothetical protein
MDRYQNAFMMDFENACLQDWPGLNWPKGNTRHLDPEWAAYMKKEISNSDVTWIQYCKWVEGGGGDEWFHEPPLSMSTPS